MEDEKEKCTSELIFESTDRKYGANEVLNITVTLFHPSLQTRSSPSPIPLTLSHGISKVAVEHGCHVCKSQGEFERTTQGGDILY
eukprot:1331132-Amorphochlora_amoeboformis.AAC.1